MSASPIPFRPGSPAPAAGEPAIFEAIAEQLAAKILPALKAEVNARRPIVEARLLSVRDAALYLGRTASAIEHLIHEKKIVPVRIDRRVQIDRRDLDQLIEEAKGIAI